MSIQAIVLATFDAKEGYNVENYYPGDFNVEGIEYLLFPSGIQELDNCTIFFRFQDQLCLSVFSKLQHPSFERSAFFTSVGLILSDDINFGEAVVKYGETLLYIANGLSLATLKYKFGEDASETYASEKCTSHQLSDSDFFKSLQTSAVNLEFDSLFEKLQGNKFAILGANSKELSQSYATILLDHLGPAFYCLYKFALQRKRILLISSHDDQLYSIIDMIVRLSSIKRSSDASIPILLSDLHPFYSVGLANTSTLLDNDLEEGWIACTTDTVLLSKSSLYDLALYWPDNSFNANKYPQIFNSNSIRIKPSYDDLINFKGLSRYLSFDGESSWGLTTYSLASKYIFNTSHHNLTDQEFLNENMLDYFQRYNQKLLTVLSSNAESFNVSDMQTLGLNPCHSLDKSFVSEISQIWLKKHINWQYGKYFWLRRVSLIFLASTCFLFILWKLL
ncbi:DENN domain-like containing protein, implicated in vesicle formation/trafficking [Schizosaccharomyces pombe]|uniref:Uncharacterized protein C119.16c n=1 Tax=Schizosaccharomyces pombe (strain 972 / ATCC 24843) TaxID=284812 RepID=YBAG_SCHPO|nr:uncharacterized protein SPBC119.16c [Schizosaccharomyces pombe]O42907.1 RecName: Full=Uncharacterized protein C119.16c [Schizosaccharomyces pombe 972h-]CAA17931.1 conserved fungal protein [Schizosaccharomyces pombe]|eukprot:NP_595298.1 uncharacterized protein SPBC119.16c [Schizosaccharomyces pombe]